MLTDPNNLFTYNDSTFNIGNIKFLFSSFKTTENGNVIIKIDNPNFKSVLFCDCRSDFYRTYPNNLITFTKDNNKNCLKYSNGLMIQYGQITDYTPEMGSILTIPFLEPFKSTAFWAASALNAAKAYPSRILEYKSIEISFNGGSSYISWLVFGTWK